MNEYQITTTCHVQKFKYILLTKTLHKKAQEGNPIVCNLHNVNSGKEVV